MLVFADFVFIGSALSKLVESHNHGSHGLMSRETGILLALPIVIVFALRRDYKFLANTSAMGLAALVFAMIVTMADVSRCAMLFCAVGSVFMDCVFHLCRRHSCADATITYFAGSTYPLFLGNAAFLYLVRGVILLSANC